MQNESDPKPVIVLAAGSLCNAFVGIIDSFERQSGISVQVEHGPAGLLREKIEQGAAFDVFASANMEHPRRLHDAGLSGPAFRFARNRLCLIVRRDLGMTAKNMLDILINPMVKLATSTPGADPSGDYALQFFELVNVLHPGKGDLLAAKARALVGGRAPALVPTGKSVAGWLIEQGLADVFVSYASNGQQCSADINLSAIGLPDAMGPVAEYGVTLNPDGHIAAPRFQRHLLSPLSQRELERCGFLA
jgi:molybdate transport system substrate-binding protein